MAKIEGNIKQLIRDMEVGSTISLPIEKLETIRVTASNLSAMLQRTYATKRSDDGKTYQVTRTA